MKKSFKILAIAAFIIICLVALVGCDNTLDKAYNQAVADGFVGTQSEWLSSLTAGKSAYEIAVDNGFVGTEAEWIAGLSGKDGKDGKNGLDGANGAAGLDGIDAQSPTILEIFQETVRQGFTGDFDDFVQQYLQINVAGNTEIASNIAMRSSVSVYCKSSAGSGIIYQLDKEKGDAFIITNYHVVYDSSSANANKISETIAVYLYGMEFGPNNNSGYLDYSIPAEYIGGSMTYDIAVIKVTGSQILKDNAMVRAANIGNSNNVPIGSTVISIGNAAAGGLSVTTGVISVDSEQIAMIAVDGVTPVNFRVQRTDSAINNGNSGGGLFNASGELIGIVNAKISSSEIENIGYAIPSNIAIGATNNIIDNCDGKENEKIKKAVLGVMVRISNSESLLDDDNLFLNIVNEITVDSVSDGSIALSAGVEVGDKISYAKIGGVKHKVERLFTLSDLLFDVREGETIVLTVQRMVDGEEITMDIEIPITAAGISTIE